MSALRTIETLPSRNNDGWHWNFNMPVKAVSGGSIVSFR